MSIAAILQLMYFIFHFIFVYNHKSVAPGLMIDLVACSINWNLFIQDPYITSLPVSATVSPYFSINLITRKQASLHGVDKTVLHVKLLVYLNQAAMIVLPFAIINNDIGFKVIFGSQWKR